MNSYDCIIVGGGAAGMTAAITAAQNGRKVLLLEKMNSCGRKISITGKGRCNVTNNCGRDEFFENIPTNPRFLYSAYSAFDPQDCMDFFERLGVPLKTERGNRVFPVSDKAQDIVRALEQGCEDFGVKIIYSKVTEILAENGEVHGVKCGDRSFYAKSVLIAAGGCSYPKTGSDGGGYRLAEALGHTVTEIRPSLVPIESDDDYCRDMMGLSLKNVLLTLKDTEKNRTLFSEQGEMLFTHFGVSGPLVLSASAHIPNIEGGRYIFYIDLKPALDEKKLDERILRDFGEIPNRIFANSLSKLLPAKMISTVVTLSGIDGEKQVNSVTKQERRRLVSLLKAFPVHIRCFRPIEEAIVTSGGIKTSEISPKTMESKLVKGLYFAGEIIDVDAYTGGFNLQIAFSTGVLAGKNM